MKLFISILLLNATLFADIPLPQNFQTSFNQKITNEKGEEIKYEGSVIFKNITRGFFKWSYSSPTQKEVCTDGTQLIVLDHDLEQVSTYLIDDGINLEEILKVSKEISKYNYEATYKEVKYLITLDSKEQLEAITYVDNLDNVVEIIFNNMNYNTTIDDATLECNAPQDYDIIKG